MFMACYGVGGDCSRERGLADEVYGETVGTVGVIGHLPDILDGWINRVELDCNLIK